MKELSCKMVKRKKKKERYIDIVEEAEMSYEAEM
jgi:hypothetical protein